MSFLSAFLALIDHQSQDCKNVTFFSFLENSSFEKIVTLQDFGFNNENFELVFAHQSST